MPLWVSGAVQAELVEEGGGDQRDHADAQADRDDQQVVAVLEVDLGEDLDAGRGDHAEHGDPGAAKHGYGDRGDDGRQLGQQAQGQQDDAGHRHDPAAPHAGHADQTDVLRDRGVGEGVEDAADQRAEAVGAQAARQVVLADRAVGQFAQRQEHAGGFDHHDQHDEAEREDRPELEYRRAEGEGVDDGEPRCFGQARKN